MFFENRLPRCWISEGEGDRDLAKRKGVKLILDSRGQEVFALFRGHGNQEKRGGH
jgi:hypothetical protein